MSEIQYGLERNSFLLDPRFDAKIFAGRSKEKKKIEQRIKRGLATNSSVHTFIYGDFGAGKTHTLNFFHQTMSEIYGNKILPIFVNRPGVGPNSSPIVLYKSIMMAIPPAEIFDLFTTIFDQHGDEIKEYTNIHERTNTIRKHIMNRDLSYIIHKYESTRPQEDYLILKWLSGEKCTSGEKQNLMVISDNSDPNMAIKTLLCLLTLFNKYKKRYVLLLLDELDTLSILSTKRLQEFENFFRELVNEQIGMATIMAESVSGTSLEDGLDMFLPRTPVGNRIGYPQNYIYLSPFEDITIIREFMVEMMSQLRPKDVDLDELININQKSTSETLTKELYPITDEALEILANLTYDSGEALIPRTIQTNANDCLGDIISQGKAIITSEVVENTIIL